MSTQNLLILIAIVIIIGFFILYRTLVNLNSKKENDEGLKVLTEWLKGMQASVDRNTDVTQKQLSDSSKALNERLDKAATVIAGVQKEIGEMSEIGRSMKQLQDFLRSPKMRGNIGEQVLKELLGQFLPKESFNLQHRFKSGEIVDAAIKTDSGIIPIDAKFPLENFRQMNSSEKESDKALYQKEFARDVKKHIDDIANKYILPEEGTIDYALMYIPSEAIYYEIMANNQRSFGLLSQKTGTPCFPATFYAYLRTILISFEGKKIEEKASAIITSLRAIRTESDKFAESLRVLTKHIQDTKNTSDLVNNRFGNLSNKISTVAELDPQTQKRIAPRKKPMGNLEGLNKEQRKAVTTTEEPLLIIAGAGTGKTTVITRRIAYLIEKKLAKPAEILALTFTDKAAAEMEERVDVLVPYGYVDTWISTFHAFGDRVLREKALEIGLPSDFQVMSRAQQVLFVEQNLFSFKLKYFRPLSNPTKFIEAILSFISRLKDESVLPSDYENFIKKLKKKKKTQEELVELEKQEELASFYEHYEKLKSSAGRLDYGDQVLRTLELFRNDKTVLKSYQERFKYILVDEYQDTNYAQNELVKILAAKHKNIAVVGDDDQSIYKFRGAAISNILKFKKDYPSASQIILSENYRSTQALLDSSYRLIQFNNPDRLEIKNKINKKLISSKKARGEAPSEEHFETLSEEADFVAKEIQNLIKNKVNYSDIAILVRANSQADPFIRTLNLKKIPFKFSGLASLYSQPEIRLLISFLKTITNFDDSLSLYDLAVSEIYQLSLQDAILASGYANKKNKTINYIFRNLRKLEDFEVSDEGAAVIKKIISDQDNLIEFSRAENAGKILFRFLENTHYLKRLEKENSVEAVLKIQNIAKFFDKIREFNDQTQNESVLAFVNYLITMQAVGEDPTAADFDPDLNAVSVLTAHAAKGLEFKTVFMVGLVADRFPSRERADQIAVPEELIAETLPEGDFHLQEERRLFYVGSTRAKEKLYYTWSRDAGGKRLKKISPFVLEALDKPASAAKTESQDPREKINQFAPLPKIEPIKVSKREKTLIRLTQSSIDDYETCAYKYRYAHILRLPIPTHHAIVYGFALHAVVAEFWKARLSGRLLGLKELYKILDQVWVNEGFLTAEHEEQRLTQAKVVVKSFWDREKKSKNLPTFIEKDFRFNLNRDSLQIAVTGRYDRVDDKDGKVSIIDYKTTENRTEEQLEKYAKDSVQLKIYTLAYFKNYGKVPDFVGIYDLESGLVAGYSPEKDQLEKTESEIIEVAKNIQNNLQEDNFPANPKYFGRTPACFYCPYNSICPFSLTRK